MTEFNNNNKYVPQVPKTYEVKYVEQQDLYPDLIHEDINETRGYGPCKGCGRKDIKFKLEITLKNRAGSTITKTVYDVDDATSEASNIIAASGH